MTEFIKFPKVARYSKPVIVTEKINGTNGQIYIGEDGEFLVGSRKRWITPEDDNHGFAQWAFAHKEELMQLGPGRHFGEWWGYKIQNSYNLKENRFSLFNTIRWAKSKEEIKQIQTENAEEIKYQEVIPNCCDIVPIIWTGDFDDMDVYSIMEDLRKNGSHASPGFMHPEGIMIYHVAAGVMFKKTFKKDKGKWDI